MGVHPPRREEEMGRGVSLTRGGDGECIPPEEEMGVHPSKERRRWGGCIPPKERRRWQGYIPPKERRRWGCIPQKRGGDGGASPQKRGGDGGCISPEERKKWGVHPSKERRRWGGASPKREEEMGGVSPKREEEMAGLHPPKREEEMGGASPKREKEMGVHSPKERRRWGVCPPEERRRWGCIPPEERKKWGVHPSKKEEMGGACPQKRGGDLFWVCFFWVGGCLCCALPLPGHVSFAAARVPAGEEQPQSFFLLALASVLLGYLQARAVDKVFTVPARWPLSHQHKGWNSCCWLQLLSFGMMGEMLWGWDIKGGGSPAFRPSPFGSSPCGV
ncbi:serine/arginine repetitive matrix protein 1-like [Apus apus]|uniref:serine/arginine repetitive matrix protein 1-like n=1 Tax=Apus apus TaxID=8895 RepID=UPI0021F90588|nr:serine/arginine repetitive matrix protein 1-like [Apus apus]